MISGNRCLTSGKKRPVYMNPVPVGRGDLLSFSATQPPAAAPSPVWTVSDVTEPPFPTVAVKPHTGTNSSETVAPPKQPSEKVFTYTHAILLVVVLTAGLLYYIIVDCLHYW